MIANLDNPFSLKINVYLLITETQFSPRIKVWAKTIQEVQNERISPRD
jgi:hypothetical protein